MDKELISSNNVIIQMILNLRQQYNPNIICLQEINAHACAPIIQYYYTAYKLSSVDLLRLCG